MQDIFAHLLSRYNTSYAIREAQEDEQEGLEYHEIAKFCEEENK